METSADGVHWQRDARYFYYPHGPLERTELGAHVVQGTDYAYTLQGWLKGINGDRLDQRTDMGRDGDPSLSPNPNLNVGRDAFAMSLGYYGDADYKGIGTAWDDDQPATIAQRPFAPIGMPGIGSTLATAHKPLYNGNIAHTVNSLQPFGLWGPNGQGQVLAQVYAYDQLNRLKKARGVIGLDVYNTWEGVDDDAAVNRYRSEYEYDANGNILSAERYDADGTGHYDSFEYHYQMNGTRLQRNRLYELFDDAPTTTGDDIVAPTGTFDNSTSGVNANNNYRYDALGNLIRDERAEIHAIDWTVAGKVRSVARTLGSTLKPLQFAYGASGQRVMKQVGEPGTDAGAYREHYIRDAQGNIMATYRYTNDAAVNLQLNERPIYGSSRLGSYVRPMDLYNASALISSPPPTATIQKPLLRYELTDHLGNVAAVVTGRLLPSQSLAPYEADLVSAQGYEPFGALLPGRNYSSNYRWGFNGAEKDDEVHNATGTSYDFGARLYDPRTGRWLSTDAYAAKYPTQSPYSFGLDNPIKVIDVGGDSVWVTQTSYPLRNGTCKVIKTIHVTVAVYNAASETHNMVALASRMQSDLNRALTDQQYHLGESGEQISYVADVQVRAASCMDEVLPTDHLITLVDDVTAGDGLLMESYGVSMLNGQSAFVQADNQSYGQILSTALHELGHLMGLREHREDPSNYMSIGDAGTTFDRIQLNTIVKRAEDGVLNEGAP